MIEFQGAAVHTPQGDPIVHPLTLKLTQSRVALIGLNGSGKSTIARLINGLVTPSEGRVLVHSSDGLLDTVRDGKRVRTKVGFMFTDPRAQLVMPTAGEDVSLSLKKLVRSRPARAEAVTAVLSEYGLDGRAEQSVHTLSGGQQQLLAMASVLATDPEILVADEPTTLLDLRNTLRITERLLSLPQQVVIATHNLDLAARCDRALLIDHGRVLADGAPAEVIDRYRAHASDGRHP